LIEHLIAFGWIYDVVIFSFLSWTVFSLSQDEWRRFDRLVPREWQVVGLLVGGLFCLYFLCWALFGFNLARENPLYAYHRYDAPLLSIGVFFYALPLFGVGVQICIGGLLHGAPVETDGSVD